ncbi:MAG TPA: cytochrome c oxidase assembly protein [Solirubrobacteraceae bacterium]|nr:cytochrome c oxidase assembly protein [Solirubrobacteraceae bacterium]
MSWHGWSVQPPLLYVAVGALLYWVGGRGYHGRPYTRWEEASFAAGLVLIVLALESPLDAYADRLFWVHMVQHIVLLTWAPPLILLGRPWPRMWRGIPLRWRTSIGRALARERWTAPVRLLAHPLAAVIVFNGSIVFWHLRFAFNATLTNGFVHDVEHAMFFFCGLLFWARVIDPGPLRPRLVWPMRLAFVVCSMIVSWVIAVILATSLVPLYPAYAHLTHLPGGLTPLADQQIAGGIMWVPGSFAYGVTILAGVYRWLEPGSRSRGAGGVVTTG